MAIGYSRQPETSALRFHFPAHVFIAWERIYLHLRARDCNLVPAFSDVSARVVFSIDRAADGNRASRALAGNHRSKHRAFEVPRLAPHSCGDLGLLLSI